MWGKDYIENLQNLPEISRRRILVGSTFSITAFIFIVWLSVRLYNLNAVDLNGKGTDEFSQSPFKDVSGAFEQFSKVASSGFSDLKRIIFDNSTSTSDLSQNNISSTSIISNEIYDQSLDFGE